jgi:hypothetical protein
VSSCIVVCGGGGRRGEGERAKRGEGEEDGGERERREIDR